MDFTYKMAQVGFLLCRHPIASYFFLADWEPLIDWGCTLRSQARIGRPVTTTWASKDVYGRNRKFGNRSEAIPENKFEIKTKSEYQTCVDELISLGHFERRKLALGECGRAYGSDCIYEHACVRCPVLVMITGDKPRLLEIRDNLSERISEAEREGWLGEIEGLSVSLDTANQKISQIDERDERRTSPVFMGVPAFEAITGRAIETQGYRVDGPGGA